MQKKQEPTLTDEYLQHIQNIAKESSFKLLELAENQAKQFNCDPASIYGADLYTLINIMITQLLANFKYSKDDIDKFFDKQKKMANELLDSLEVIEKNKKH